MRAEEDGTRVYDFTVPVYVLDEKRASARVGLSIEPELREDRGAVAVVIAPALDNLAHTRLRLRVADEHSPFVDLEAAGGG